MCVTDDAKGMGGEFVPKSHLELSRIESGNEILGEGWGALLYRQGCVLPDKGVGGEVEQEKN